MRSVQLSAAVIAASFFLTLSGAHCATSSDAASPNAPTNSYSSTVEDATDLDVLVGAAEAGNVDAMNLLGVVYTVGTLVPRDYSLAIRWFQKAADGGSATAMSNLATLYLFGIGTSRDHATALRWFAHAAEFGDVHSMYNVGVMSEKVLGTARPAACEVDVLESRRSGLRARDGMGQRQLRRRSEREARFDRSVCVA